MDYRKILSKTREFTLRKRGGEYDQRGDYHINLDLHWPYLPVYLAKMDYARKFLERYGQGAKIVDLGSGEGVLVEEHLPKGYDILGVDLNYESEHVVHGDLLGLEYPDNSFDIALCLDVIEHLHYHQQEVAIGEIARVLKPGGKLLLSVPNLAHLASRFSFFFLGRLLRTSTIDRHIGDRPIHEYLDMLKEHFRIVRRAGMFPTFPLISLLTYYVPSKVVTLHKVYNRLLGYPNWCFLNAITCEKPRTAPASGGDV